MEITSHWTDLLDKIRNLKAKDGLTSKLFFGSINKATENAATKCRKNDVGAKTSDIRAGSNNTSFTTTRYHQLSL